MSNNKEITIQLSDQSTNVISLFEANSASIGIAILFLPALGVRASYYSIMAAALQKKGVNVATVDWRGQGKSSLKASKKNDYGYAELIKDTEEVVAKVKTIFPDDSLFIMGHSLGGQIASLLAARKPGLFAGLILISSCTVYYKGWPGFSRLRVLLGASAILMVSKILGFYPGDKMGFGGREAKTQMRDWALNAFNGKYQVKNDSFDYEKALSQLKIKALSITLEGDDFAPPKACQNLFQKYSPAAEVQHKIVTKKESNLPKLNHFNWAKTPEYFVQLVSDWLGKQ